jgi:hypothetical protein
LPEGGRGGNITTPSKARDELGRKAKVSGNQYEKRKKILKTRMRDYFPT